MTHQQWIVRLGAIVLATAACSTSSSDDASKKDTMTVQGTVAQELRANGGVEAVALGQDGRSFWSALDTKGDFKLVVPVGQSYRIVLARSGSTDGKPVAAYHLALATGAGKTRWIVARTSTTLRLGELLPAGTLASRSTTAAPEKRDPTAVGTAARGSGRGGYEDGSDGDDHEDSNSGSGRGGTAGTDTSNSGSGRGGTSSSDDDDHDDYEDDQSHADDPPCEEKKDSAPMCSAPDAKEVECSRNGADDVAGAGDWSNPSGGDAVAACSAPSTPEVESK